MTRKQTAKEIETSPEREDAMRLFTVVAKVRFELAGIAEEDLTTAEKHIWALVKDYGANR